MRLAGLDKSKFLRYDMEDGGNYPLGWDTVFDNKKLAICGKICKTKNGELVFAYMLADRRYCHVPIRRNPLFSGMSLLGRVLRSEGYHVWLHLDIDNDQDMDAAFPFPWVPETGNLMYLMPKAGTRVSLYFGDDNERNGRAINCIRENAPRAPAR